MNVLGIIAFVVPCLASVTIDARAADWRPDAVFTQLGAGDATESWSAGAQWHWRREWRPGDSLLVRGRWELAIGRWEAETDDGERDRTWITQLSAVPTLRLSRAAGRGWYAEIGSGPSLLIPVYRSRDRRFSTEFNFQSHLAFGYLLGEHGEHDLGLRVDHYSNAGIEEPNPGLNLGSLRYTYRFGNWWR